MSQTMTKKFNSMTCCNSFLDNSIDLSNCYEPIYEYLEPLAVDIETGKILNKSNFRKLVHVGNVNVDEDIQSYFKDVDLYHILERVAMSGDNSLLKVRSGSSLDLSFVPDNINDFNDMMRIYSETLRKGDKTIASAILNNNMSDTEIINLIAQKVAENNSNGGNN